MIRHLNCIVFVSVVSGATEWSTTEWNTTEWNTTDWNATAGTTTRKWTRKKPAYWEFPETTTSEKPDISAEYCKSVDMTQLGENMTNILNKPVRGQAEDLLQGVVLYVLTLHRFIRKYNTTDDVAKLMAKDLIDHKRPKFMDMKLDMPLINIRVGFDKYEFQHFKWVMDDIHKSWEKLKNKIYHKESDQDDQKSQKDGEETEE